MILQLLKNSAKIMLFFEIIAQKAIFFAKKQIFVKGI